MTGPTTHRLLWLSTLKDEIEKEALPSQMTIHEVDVCFRGCKSILIVSLLKKRYCIEGFCPERVRERLSFIRLIQQTLVFTQSRMEYFNCSLPQFVRAHDVRNSFYSILECVEEGRERSVAKEKCDGISQLLSVSVFSDVTHTPS